MDNPYIYTYKGAQYPNYLKEGDAGQYIFPIAKKWCKGIGLDIGGTPTCSFPEAKIINCTNPDGYDAYNIPEPPPDGYDYIFSSHTMEHIPNYIAALEIWKKSLKKPNGVLFLYLPHPEMEYWLPFNNRKHLHSFTPKYIKGLFYDIGFKYIFNSEIDLFFSFSVVGML